MYDIVKMNIHNTLEQCSLYELMNFVTGMHNIQEILIINIII